ncbi:MAG: NAD(+)/NADH kinase [Lachnospiraceae bacterium]|nr:NAD(+)/NADH kinase [Lachnospiraceae bacterium]
MEHFYLITNEAKDPQGLYTERITAYLKKRGGSVVCMENTATAFDTVISSNGEPADNRSVSGACHGEEAAQCILVLGGDGTLLRAARNVMGSGIPLIGINLGTLGYLAEVDIGMIEPALDQLLTDRFTREERMMLEGQVKKQDATDENFALNDIVIVRSGPLQILTFHIYVNGQFLNSYCADGMIVATPTGSTGYNMSAGGPIANPGAELILLTPICPHTLNTRSIVLASEDEIRIEIPQGKDGQQQTVEANFDGSHKMTLQTGDGIVIRKALKTTGILKLNTESFLTVLHKKMSE